MGCRQSSLCSVNLDATSDPAQTGTLWQNETTIIEKIVSPIASVTKSDINASALQLSERGDIEFNDTAIKKYSKSLEDNETDSSIENYEMSSQIFEISEAVVDDATKNVQPLPKTFVKPAAKYLYVQPRRRQRVYPPARQASTTIITSDINVPEATTSKGIDQANSAKTIVESNRSNTITAPNAYARPAAKYLYVQTKKRQRIYPPARQASTTTIISEANILENITLKGTDQVNSTMMTVDSTKNVIVAPNVFVKPAAKYQYVQPKRHQRVYPPARQASTTTIIADSRTPEIVSVSKYTKATSNSPRVERCKTRIFIQHKTARRVYPPARVAIESPDKGVLLLEVENSLITSKLENEQNTTQYPLHGTRFENKIIRRDSMSTQGNLEGVLPALKVS